ncbi:putative beta-lysine N-acetyltransferase [Alkalibacter mobilis]|uniref:putative beta-lysine N-acetyltransferase n=1 Tax=Alkalibacter mobilis TaxID=2787712 RepID=UPI00189C7E8D|nr:putative beta-lysine N-acetyltransferase [Alkalibacter mobilis]MBF7096205.1 putative beta-lysine N-acetyltransferase [Alkalibacter mobilis]
MDLMEKIRNSTVQHGKDNDRIYLMKLAPEDTDNIIGDLEAMALQNAYSKIFIKVPEKYMGVFMESGFVIEAKVPGFFSDGETCVFMGKYYSSRRSVDRNQEKTDNVLSLAANTQKKEPKLDDSFQIKVLKPSDAEEMALLYGKVFKTYPFPIHDPKYIRQTMSENLIYFGAIHEGRIAALGSCETDPENKNSEMTDFATLPEYRGKSLASNLLTEMEIHMKNSNYNALYTIARSQSFGMNLVFAKAGYKYSGTLINNTNIAGNIESMNVWYKNI